MKNNALAAIRSGAIAVMAMAWTACASAETIDVSGVYASRADLPGNVERIVTEPFGGDAGPDALIAITDRLGSAIVEGQPWFRFTSSSFGSNAGEVPDAALRGSVRTEVTERRVQPRIVKECVERDDNKKCVRREEVRIACWQLDTLLIPRISLVDADGRRLYSRQQSQSKSVRYCRDDDTIPSAISQIDALIDDLAFEVRRDLVPDERTVAVRVMESRKDLAKSDRNAFRAAVKLTDNDAFGACLSFREMEPRNPRQVSLLYNIGLCEEAEGKLELSAQYYERALDQSPGRDYPTRGLIRLREHERGLIQIEARNGVSEP
ncbi:MAG: hypothetical protein SXU28_02100 [Pseudomonadota bacterium]|nr:hypothetical protein [Pseudomonadota bacterium]